MLISWANSIQLITCYVFEKMNVISENKEILNATVSISEINGISGLVLESRGGAKGKTNERNSDYQIALDLILKRLQDLEVKKIVVYVVSSVALRNWNQEEQKITINGSNEISLAGVNPENLRKAICNAQAKKKPDPKTRGGNPSKRIIVNAKISRGEWLKIVNGTERLVLPISEHDIASNEDVFESKSNVDSREKVTRAIAVRQGQPIFRKKLLKAYESCCAISGTQVSEILEAAHIIPYNGNKTNSINNGLLLRADIHTLFDLGLIGVDENYEILTSPKLENTEYEIFKGKKIKLPYKQNDYPNKKALKTRAIPKANH